MKKPSKETERIVKECINKCHIMLACRIIKLKFLPDALIFCRISKNLGVEKIVEILDELESQHRLMICSPKEKEMADGKYEIYHGYAIDGTEVPELGKIGLNDIFGDRLSVDGDFK